MSNKWVKRISRALLPCFVFFVFSFSFAPKVYAADAEVVIAYGAYGEHLYTTGASGGFSNMINTATTPVIDGAKAVAYPSGTRIFNPLFYTSDGTVFYSPVKVYMSFYPRGAGTVTEQGNFVDKSSYSVTYMNSFGATGTVVGGLDVFKSVPNSLSKTGNIYVMEASFEGTETEPVRNLDIRRSDLSNALRWYKGDNVSELFFPSIRVITTQYSAEMEQLDKVADAIVEQNDLLLAMKGDIVAILQDIYTMTGDMYVAQNLLNSYVAQLLPLIQDIDQTTTNIYSLLSSQLRLLETAIENAADSIEAAIAAQTAAMIAYLEQYFNTGNEVPDDTYQQQQDAENILDQMGTLEKPDVNTIVPEIGDYTDGGVSGVLGAIFSSNLIVTMMTLSASFAFGAYVLFGKRD